MAKENSAVKMEIDPSTSAAFAEATEPKPIKKRLRRRPDLHFVRGTVLVPRGTYRRLQDIARDESTSFQGIVEEALEAWLSNRGEPPFFPPDWRGWMPKEEEAKQ